MEVKWVMYALLTLLVALGFTGLYFGFRIWKEPVD